VNADQQGARWEGRDLILRVRVQPRASKDEVVGLQGGSVKIRITAPPIDGKANAHLIRFLATTFGVPKSRIRILSGETGREKRLHIESPSKLPACIRPSGM
jgi:uncharacterized protein (TIGR00251 family)